jgi:hypothetical protein
VLKLLFEKLYKNKYQNELSKENRLKNILDFGKNIIFKEKEKIYNRFSIYIFIKMLADKIVMQNSIDVIESYETKMIGNFELLNFMNLLTKDNIEQNILNEINIRIERIKIKNPIEINLATEPIITTAWDRNRLSNAIATIGTDNSPWKEQKTNHLVDLFLPIGLSFVANGNHSIASGLLKKQGIITIDGINTNHNIYYISNLFKYMYFDGVYYRKNENAEILFTAANFDFGCIFELGRIIEKNKLSFTS